MKTTKIPIPYAGNANKANGQTLSASEWNALSAAARDAQTAVNSIFADTVVLTNASQATAENKVYSVQSSIDLKGGTLTMPAGCTLLFEGGSISNGSLVLNNTRIEGNASFSNVTISGSCANEVLTPQMFGAVGGNESATPSRDTKGFKNLAAVVDNAGTKNKVIYIPAGHYAIDEKITILSGCTVYGDGDATVIDVYGGTGSVVFGQESERATLLENVTIAANASKGDTSIQLNDASSISAGDYLIITDTADFSFYRTRSYYRTSELLKVLAVDQDTVMLDGALYGNYFTGTGSSTTIERDGNTLDALDFGNDEVSTMGNSFTYRTAILKFSPVQYLLSDFKIVSHAHEKTWPWSNSAYYTFEVLGHVDSRLKNISVINNGNVVGANICLFVGLEMTNCSVKSYTTYIYAPGTSRSADNYGLSIGAGLDFKVYGGTFRGTDHSIATGGSSRIYGINNREFVYDSVSFEDKGELNGIELDVHANAEYYEFRNVDAPKAMCDTGGYHVTVTNCRFKDVSSTFHIAGLVVKDCELMSPIETLFYFNFDHVDYENASIVFENNKIHGGAHFNLQDGAHEIKAFVWRNNLCEGLYLRRGKIRNVIIENNIFTDSADNRVLINNLVSDSVAINNNVINNGYVWINNEPGYAADGLTKSITVNGNVISFSSEGTLSDALILLDDCTGVVSNNRIDNGLNNISIKVIGNSDIIVSENMIKQGTAADTGSTRVFACDSANATLRLYKNVHNGGQFYAYSRNDGKLFIEAPTVNHCIGSGTPLGRYIYPGFVFIQYAENAQGEMTYCKPLFAVKVEEDTVTWVDASGNVV